MTTTNTRTKCLEIPVNTAESTTIKEFARHVGMAVAVFARFAMLQHIDAHDAKEVAQQESRKRRDAPVASRASAGRANPGHPAVRHRPSARIGFGGGMRPIRV